MYVCVYIDTQICRCRYHLKNNFKQANKKVKFNATEMLHAPHSNFQ